MLTDQQFLNFIIKDNNVIPKAQTYYKKPEIKEYIDNKWDGLLVAEVAYRLLNNIQPSIIQTCKYCDNPTKYRSFTHGYAMYCYKSCAAKDNDPIQKVEDQTVTKQAVTKTFINIDTNSYIEQRLTTAYLNI